MGSLPFFVGTNPERPHLHASLADRVGGRLGGLFRLANHLQRELVPADEVFGLGAGENAGGGADRADAACPGGAGELQAFELRPAFEQADDIARVESVASARAVDKRNRISADVYTHR